MPGLHDLGSRPDRRRVSRSGLAVVVLYLTLRGLPRTVPPPVDSILIVFAVPGVGAAAEVPRRRQVPPPTVAVPMTGPVIADPRWIVTVAPLTVLDPSILHSFAPALNSARSTVSRSKVAAWTVTVTVAALETAPRLSATV